MLEFNAQNERIKKEYFRFLAEADRKSQASIDAVCKAINRFENHTGFKDLASFNRDQAVAFKKELASTGAKRTGGPLSKSTMHATTNALKAFFRWLYSQPGYRSRINPTEIEYLNLSEKDVRAAKQPAVKRFPTLEQVRHVVFSMPMTTVVERRDRALIAFTIVTGMRDDAIASIRLKHVETDLKRVIQNPLEMRTKFSKQIVTYFFPVGADLHEIVFDWVRELREMQLFGHDDPVFPMTRIVQDDERCFTADGIVPAFWANAEPIRVVFRRAFKSAGLDYYNPHAFRDTLVALGKKKCRTPEEFEAWSKNLGHEEMITTFRSYGHFDSARQGELINAVGNRREDEDRLEKIYDMIERLAQRDAEMG
jgi:integrase